VVVQLAPLTIDPTVVDEGVAHMLQYQSSDLSDIGLGGGRHRDDRSSID
jgi:hypothetical protein